MRIAGILSLVFLLSGCAGTRWLSDDDVKRVAEAHAHEKSTGDDSKSTAKSDSTRQSAEPAADPNNSPAPPDGNDLWQQSLTHLRQRNDLDPATQAKLLADMEQVDPVYRPMMARMLDAVLAPPGDAAPSASSQASAPPREPVTERREYMSPRAPLAVAPVSAPEPAPQVTGRNFDLPAMPAASVPTSSPQLFLPPWQNPSAAIASVQPAPAPAPTAAATAPAAVVASVPPAAVAPQAPPAASEPKVEPPSDWRKELQDAIAALQIEIGKLPEKDATRQRFEVEVKLLQLAAGEKESAVKGLERVDPWVRDYWKHQLHALAVGLDDGGTPVASRRAALALRELHEATSCLAVGSALDVRNLAFCTQVDSFGRFTEFPKSEFQPNQELLLYAEIDNVSVTQSPAGFESSLQGSYQILDASGQRVADVTFPVETDVCRNRRRDYFIPFRLYVPKKIDPGRHTLQLTVEDLKGKKFGQGSIDFTVVAGSVAAAGAATR